MFGWAGGAINIKAFTKGDELTQLGDVCFSVLLAVLEVVLPA